MVINGNRGYGMVMDKLTLKQQIYAQEYIKSSGNGTEAVRKAYRNITTERARAVMSSKLQKNKNIQEKIAELKAGVFDNDEELVAMIRNRLVADFQASQNLRDTVTAARTLLELTGQIGARGASTSATINISVINNGTGGFKITDLSDLGLASLWDLQDQIQQCINTFSDKLNRHEQSNKQSSVYLNGDNLNNNATVTDGVVVNKTGGDYLQVNEANKTEGTLPAEKNINPPEEVSPPQAIHSIL